MNKKDAFTDEELERLLSRTRHTTVELREEQVFRLRSEAVRRGPHSGGVSGLLRDIIDIHFRALDKNKKAR